MTYCIDGGETGRISERMALAESTEDFFNSDRDVLGIARINMKRRIARIEGG